MRLGSGEIAAADEGELPDLVEISTIKGDLHSHTTLSDGRNSLEEMAAAAKQRGYSYFAITDHSASHGFGNHVTDKMLEKRIAEVARVQQGQEGIPPACRLRGQHRHRGRARLSRRSAEELDWVIGSVHTSFRMSEKNMTERVVAAIEHPLVDCIGHLTGRMLLRREPYGIDVEKVFEAAAANGTMIEINGNPNRRDLSDRHARLAAQAGVTICLNTDAHGIETLDNMRYAIATARRAWLEPKNVANTRTWAQFSKLRKRDEDRRPRARRQHRRAAALPAAARPRSDPSR